MGHKLKMITRNKNKNVKKEVISESETSLSKVQTYPAGLVAEVKEEVNPEVEPRDKAKNNQGSSKTNHSSNQQNKKARKRPSKVLEKINQLKTSLTSRPNKITRENIRNQYKSKAKPLVHKSPMIKK